MAELVKMVAPDGGWGWMVVLGMAINNFLTIPILQNFGLVFRDVFEAMNCKREASIIINTNAAFGYVLGLMNGPLLRNLGFRKVAVAGGLMMFIGLFVTSFDYNFLRFFFFYGMINSLGIGWSMASYHLALATYFVKRRGMAMGIAMGITGLGPVVMPLIIGYLMYMFGASGTALILSGLILHTVVCGLLLQPVKWHRKQIIIENDGPDSSVPDEMKTILKTKTDPDVAFEKNHDNMVNKKETIVDTDKDDCARRSREMSIEIQTEQQNGVKKELEMLNMAKDLREQSEKLIVPNVDGTGINKVNKTEDLHWYERIVRIFDLDLLKDPVFLSMLIGMSIALASDMSFSLTLPFILGDYYFDTNTTAILQSVVGAADVLSRFFLPVIINRTKLSARVAYLLSLFGLIISRFMLIQVSQFNRVVIVVAFFGAAKGVRSVFMPLVIPNYVPLDKLPSAQGLQNIMNGLFLMMLGPVMGYVRDKTGNYEFCIHIINCLTAVTITLWTIEYVVMKNKKNTFVDVADLER